MHTLHNDPQEHLDEEVGILWIFGAAPLLAVTDTLTNALGICAVLLLTCVCSTILAALLFGPLHQLLRLTASLILTTAFVSAQVALAQAWLPSLHASLGLFPSLIACNLLLLSRLQRAATLGPVRALRQALASFAPVLLVLLILGTLRELVGRGSLLHDIALADLRLASLDVQLFTADLGFLLGLLPPGAFIAFAVLLALRNWLRSRAARATAQRVTRAAASHTTHDPSQDHNVLPTPASRESSSDDGAGVSNAVSIAGGRDPVRAGHRQERQPRNA